MNYDQRVEDELTQEWVTVQQQEADLHAAYSMSQTIFTPAPFFNCSSLKYECYVMVHGVEAVVPRADSKGGLAAWQIKRAKQMMAVQRRPALSMAEIALACGVTEGHFVREFKTSTGVSPHQWAMVQRVLTAKSLLACTRLSLERIAIGSGFFDQSHLSRWFKRVMGISPRAWQKVHAPRTGLQNA
ncbi:MAG TPA: AraC family transcriptional regulator [Pararobbsia sp.]|jgi:AraC-like DNA-binding protein|nr:AraC family transcriptional regulator [Pararobbsia sp.]